MPHSRRRQRKAIIDIRLRPRSRCRHLANSTKRNEQHIIVTDVDAFSKRLDAYAPLCENMTSLSTKPEVHNALHCSKTRPSHGYR